MTVYELRIAIEKALDMGDGVAYSLNQIDGTIAAGVELGMNQQP